VSDTASSKDPEDEKSSCKGGAGEDVEEAEAEEGNDVLDVVEVGASDSLNILVRRSCEALLLLSHNVLWGDERACSKSLPGSEKGHEEHLDENDGGVEGKRLKELLVNIQTHIF